MALEQGSQLGLPLRQSERLPSQQGTQMDGEECKQQHWELLVRFSISTMCPQVSPTRLWAHRKGLQGNWRSPRDV
jgi:hypothetical protein